MQTIPHSYEQITGVRFPDGSTRAAGYSYNPNGKLASISATESGAPRSARTFTYDSEQRLSAINGSYNNAHKLALSYAYNNAQQIVSIGESVEGESQTYTFAYDQRDQLTNETVAGTATIYGYDKAQNRVMKKTGASTPDAYSFSFANKLTNILIGAQNATHRYFYDLAGNLVTSVVNNITNIYFYNAQNKLALVRINYPNGDYILYNFLYDSLNRRVCIGRAEARWPFLPSPYDWQMQNHDGNVPIAVSHPADAIDRLFVRGAGIAEGTGDVIAEIIGTDANNAKAVFYLANHRGDTLQTYRGDKTLVAKYRYDAFGNQRTAYCVINEPENAPRYTFSTKEYLPAAGLHLYQYRAYDPIAGRWTQRDPIDYQDSINLYQFCGNNPVNATDPNGCLRAKVTGTASVTFLCWKFAVEVNIVASYTESEGFSLGLSGGIEHAGFKKPLSMVGLQASVAAAASVSPTGGYVDHLGTGTSLQLNGGPLANGGGAVNLNMPLEKLRSYNILGGTYLSPDTGAVETIHPELQASVGLGPGVDAGATRTYTQNFLRYNTRNGMDVWNLNE